MSGINLSGIVKWDTPMLLRDVDTRETRDVALLMLLCFINKISFIIRVVAIKSNQMLIPMYQKKN